jgi:hypothetical protein
LKPRKGDEGNIPGADAAAVEALKDAIAWRQAALCAGAPDRNICPGAGFAVSDGDLGSDSL